MHFKAGLAEVMSGHHACGAGTNNADGFLASDGEGRRVIIVADLVHDKAFQVADLHRAV